MRNNFLHNCINLFRLIQNHLLNPSDAMRKDHLDQNFASCNALRRYLMPMAVILTLASILSSILWNKDGINYEALIYAAIITAVQPFVVFYVAKYLSIVVFRFFKITEQTDEKAQVLSLQLMLLYFFVTLLCTLVPDSSMLNCIYIYAFYMLWFIAGEYFGITDNKRMRFMFAEVVVCTIAYILFPILLGTLTPKHP